MLTKCQKHKAEYQSLSTTAADIVRSIEGKAAGWSWANNDENLGRLKSSMVAMTTGVAGNKNFTKVLLQTAGDLKKDIEEHDELFKLVSDFNSVVTPLLAQLKAVIN